MTSEILHVKLTQVYYCAVWISTSITSIKYLATRQFLYLIYITSNFKMYVLRYMWCKFCSVLELGVNIGVNISLQ